MNAFSFSGLLVIISSLFFGFFVFFRNPGNKVNRLWVIFSTAVALWGLAAVILLALGVRGWVRNRLDGSVEAVAEGAVGAVDRFVDWCRTGPRGARVTGVEAVDEPDAGGFEAFEIVP